MWKRIDETKHMYIEVSTEGQVRGISKRTGIAKLLKQYVTDKGYYYVQYNKRRYKVHRLVAIAYIPNTHNKLTVNHLDRNKANNTVANLEWATDIENRFHSIIDEMRAIGYKIEYTMNR